MYILGRTTEGSLLNNQNWCLVNSEDIEAILVGAESSIKVRTVSGSEYYVEREELLKLDSLFGITKLLKEIDKRNEEKKLSNRNFYVM